MRNRTQFISFFAPLVIVLMASLLLVREVFAQVRTSSSYQMQSDSINIGGGLSSSTDYVQESTVGEIATGPSDSTAYALRAGYQQLQEVYVSLAISGDVVMDPDLPGVTGGTANGSTTVTVVTDNPAGYRLIFQAESDPAMSSGPNTIANYDAGQEPDYDFITGAFDAHFGFSPEGSDIIDRYKHNGSNLCAVGGSIITPQTCWEGASTTALVIAEGAGPRFPVGANTTLHFRVGIGGSAGVVPGVYTATTTVTALPL
jgi:hypothetical protein